MVSRPYQHRVVITGCGVITALGGGWRANATGFREGRVAFRPVGLFDVSGQRCRIAGEVDAGELGQDRASAFRTTSRHWERMDRAGRMLCCAGLEAWLMAGLGLEGADGVGVPLILGTTSGGMASGEAFHAQALGGRVRGRGQVARVLNYQGQRQAVELMAGLGLGGSFLLVSNACASGSNAVGMAWREVASGRSMRVVCGGYDALSQLVFAGFDSLQALSPGGCRPFDETRDGLTLGEGAAVLVLERLEEAERRGAGVLCELAGYGASTDVHHLTQPHPEGEAAVRSMQEACACAGVEASEVGYVNAHGTGTPLNDAAEARAIQTWAGGQAVGVRVSSTKASVGHLLGAAGAVEAVVAAMVLREGWLPPTRGLKVPMQSHGFRLVLEPELFAGDWVLSNSFGFGGSNASLLFRRWR